MTGDPLQMDHKNVFEDVPNNQRSNTSDLQSHSQVLQLIEEKTK